MPHKLLPLFTRTCLALTITALMACGESDNSTGLLGDPVDQTTTNSSGRPNPNPAVPSDLRWELNSFQNSDTYSDRCANPRSGTDPETGKPFPDIQGSDLHEKFWLRSISHETYLWPDEIEDKNPINFNLFDYFEELKSKVILADGTQKDHYHFYEKSADQYQHFVLGQRVGYGIHWREINDQFTVIYVEPKSPADIAGIRRGLVLAGVDSKLLKDVSVEEVNNALFPTQENVQHSILLLDNTNSATNSFSVKSSTIQSQSVYPLSTLTGDGGEKIGYMAFHAFDGTSEKELIEAVATLNNNQISELVIDLRYNGGGYIGVAAELAYMIAGSERTAGKLFSRTRYNANLEAQFANDPSAINYIFPTKTYGLSAGIKEGQSLPYLNLKRLYVLTSEDTCSASELLINSLRGIDFPVIQVGGKTCGKPYGFLPLENCGYQYYTINLQTQNAKGFGDYGSGMSPLDSVVNQGSPAGCNVEEDVNHELGDRDEKRLAAALQHISSGKCTNSPFAVKGGLLPGIGKESATQLPYGPPREFLQDNMLLK